MADHRPRRSPAPDDRRRDAARTRARILDAARTEFAAHGYAGARISAIASRAGVNQQLISYYFEGKQGLYTALAEQWREREGEIVPDDTPLGEQLRRYALESAHNPEAVRLLAWSGLEYTGPASDPDHTERADRMSRSVSRIRDAQSSGALSADLDPGFVAVMLIAAAMAPTTMPHVIEGVCGVDPRTSEFVESYADQMKLLAAELGIT